MELNSSVRVNYDAAPTPPADGRRRLSLFLNRYIEEIGRSSNLTPQDVAVLASIDWMEKHPKYTLNQAQLGRLLGIKPNQLSTKMSRFCRDGLCEPLNTQEKGKLGVNGNRNKYFRLTGAGVSALEEHAQLTFDLPAMVGAELQNLPEYKVIISRINTVLEHGLSQRFQEVRQL